MTERSSIGRHEVHRTYVELVRDPNLREESLSHARATYVPLWESAGLPVDVMLEKHEQQQQQYAKAYELSRNACLSGEGSEHCKIMKQREKHLASIIHQADEQRTATNLPKITEEIKKRTTHLPATGTIYNSTGIE